MSRHLIEDIYRISNVVIPTGILRNGMPIRETDEAACVAWLMRQEKVAEVEK